MPHKSSEPQSITFQYTKDPSMVAKYFELRERIYVDDFQLQTFKDHEDIYDELDNTSFLIICDGDKVIGGARTIFRYPDTQFDLPFEDSDFKLIDVLPELKLQSLCYCEVDRTVLLPEYRTGAIGDEIIRLSALKGRHEGAAYLFTVCPTVQVRNNRRHCAKWGIHFHIMNTITVPSKICYEGRKMHLTYTDLSMPLPKFHGDNNILQEQPLHTQSAAHG